MNRQLLYSEYRPVMYKLSYFIAKSKVILIKNKHTFLCLIMCRKTGPCVNFHMIKFTLVFHHTHSLTHHKIKDICRIQLPLYLYM